jgi:exodeoxyribonuclease X
MKIRVVDTETTGMGDDAKLVEIAWVDVDYLALKGRMGDQKQYLIKPGIPIPPEASAIHHITDEMVERDGVLFGQIHPELIDGADMFAAHNAEFDRRFVGAMEKRWICTMRCARHLYRDAPGFSNQTLRDHLKLPNPPEEAGHAHRALYDAFVTAHLLSRMLDIKTPTELVTLTQKPIFYRSLPFGKHKGEPIEDVPTSYLKWARGQDFDDDIKFTINCELKRRREQSATNEERPLIND